MAPEDGPSPSISSSSSDKASKEYECPEGGNGCRAGLLVLTVVLWKSVIIYRAAANISGFFSAIYLTHLQTEKSVITVPN